MTQIILEIGHSVVIAALKMKRLMLGMFRVPLIVLVQKVKDSAIADCFSDHKIIE